jgi:outer membrane protein OmpA-like peptidoglycan-associated protein
VVIRRHLEPFTDAETAEYIHHRLKIAGSVREPFNAEAVQEIQAFSGGYPSRINIICDHALKQGDASGLNTINGTAVRKCAKKLRKLQTKEGGKFFQENALHKDKKAGKNILPRRRAGLFITILIAVSLIALAIFYFMPEFKNNNPIRGKTVIQFAHNTSGLPLKAQEQLKRMATILDQYPDSKIKITGYTDSTGSYEYNTRISKIRAESVKTYFVKKGIDPLYTEDFWG